LQVLLAILLASTAAYLSNRLLVRSLGNISIITVVPVLEELLKTGSATLLSASLWRVHLGFGFLEAVSDIRQRPRPFPLVGYVAAWCSLVGHGAFAAVTVWGLSATGSLLWGLLLGSGLHLLWNVSVARLVEQRWGGRL